MIAKQFTLSLVAILGMTLGMASVGKAEVVNNGFLSSFDKKSPYRAGAYEEVHGVRLVAGQTYVIDLMSNQFDPYLYLENSQGRILMEDDDSGKGLNSRLIFTPTRSGTYRMVITSFGSQQTGNFTLRVSP